MLEKIRKLLIVVCVGILVFVGYNIGSYWLRLSNEKQQDEQVIKEVKKATQNSSEEATEGAKEPFTPDANTYGYMHGINSDYRGWLKWDSNIINTYLLQPSEDRSDDYLTKNIYGNTVIGGSAFIEPTATLDDQNLPIYGHSVFMTDTHAVQMMFSPLRNMVDQSYFNNNKTFKIYWQNSISCYEVFAVCQIDVTSNSWAYTRSTFDSDESVADWINTAESLNKINSNIDISPDDKFVTFQTCLYRNSDERIIVVAKKITDIQY